MNSKDLIEQCEKNCRSYFDIVDNIAYFNQEKVLNAFRQCEVGLRHFSQTNGYGYDDSGKNKLKELFRLIFSCEESIVSPLIASGTHALTLALFGVLRPGDKALSITGKPYDTLMDVIYKENSGSLHDFDITFNCLDLIGDDFDYKKIAEEAASSKLIMITRSRGYEWRNALCIDKIKKVIKFVKKQNPKIIVMVDNCYGEFVEILEPSDVGSDITVGSFIKNIGGGLAPTGAYICGVKKYIDLISGRLTAPGIGDEVGSYNAGYQSFFQGVFMAPHITAQAIKGTILMGEVMQNLGYKILPETSATHYDIIKSIKFDTADELISFCRSIQSISPIDSNVVPYPWDMPGYSNQVIMAAGTFTQGASIELSCDAPIKKPYIAYLQGGLTYEHVKLAAVYCAGKLMELKNDIKQ